MYVLGVRAQKSPTVEAGLLDFLNGLYFSTAFLPLTEPLCSIVTI